VLCVHRDQRKEKEKRKKRKSMTTATATTTMAAAVVASSGPKAFVFERTETKDSGGGRRDADGLRAVAWIAGELAKAAHRSTRARAIAEEAIAALRQQHTATTTGDPTTETTLDM
jgi:hypothetical protein